MNSGAQDAAQTGYTKRHGLPARRSLERHAHGAEQPRVGVEPEWVLLPIPAPTLRVVLLIVRVEHPAEAQDRPLGNACPFRIVLFGLGTSAKDRLR